MRDGYRNKTSMPRIGGARWLALAAGWLLLALLLGACTTTPKRATGPQVPVHFVHKDSFDITWSELRDGSDLVVYGVLRNNGSIFLKNLLMTVSLVDDCGTPVDSRTFSDFPTIVPAHASESFSMRFPCPIERSEQRVFIDLDYILANAVGPDYGVYQRINSVKEARTVTK